MNLFHGRLGHAPGASSAAEEVTYVRPHELQILAHPDEGSLRATLSQCLTVGPNTRLEFQRDDGSYVDVEVSRSEYQRLRALVGLKPGAALHLKPTRLTRFVEDSPNQQDPALLI